MNWPSVSRLFWLRTSKAISRTQSFLPYCPTNCTGKTVFSLDLPKASCLPTNGGWGCKWDTSSDVWVENMQLPLRPQFWDSNIDGVSNRSQNNGIGIEHQACKRTVAYIFSCKCILTITLQSRYCFYAQLIIDEETEAQRAWALAVKAQKLIKKLGLQVDLWGKHSNLKENIGQSHRQIKKEEEKGT